jgi:hypothetical protein
MIAIHHAAVAAKVARAAVVAVITTVVVVTSVVATVNARTATVFAISGTLCIGRNAGRYAAKCERDPGDECKNFHEFILMVARFIVAQA